MIKMIKYPFSQQFIVWSFIGILILCLIIPIVSQISLAEVSSEYQANYGIGKIWENITTNLISIQSAKKRWDQVASSVFWSLYTDFNAVFPKLPQKNNYRIIFDTCKIQSQKLAQVYSSLDFDVFMDQCQLPINSIMKEINATYTVKAKIKANPQSWSSPVTVTLDARESLDPSKDTIPSDNFFWYYKDALGRDILMWRWAVIKYTFEKEWNYYIHLTAKSANKDSQGILDGEATTVITVAPEVANLVVYANGKKLWQKNYTKIGTQEAQRWVLFDGSATLPKWWREIQSHTWKIEGINGFKYTSEILQWKPGNITTKLPNNWMYTIQLSLIDNEWNTITKSFLVAVSDPIALIKQTPENLTTSTIWTFDASSSYSLRSRIKKYNWEVFDSAGDKILVVQSKLFTKQFTKPWVYTIKLIVTDEIWESNIETNTLIVDSTLPQPQFTVQPRLEWKYPSQFVLDAGASFDIDMINKFDDIIYERSFSNPSLTKIEQQYDNNKSIVVSFDEPGKYKAKLTLTDSYGKINTFERDIEVKSSLRPVILANPRATSWWNTVRFLVTSNSEIINYEWDFGDGYKEIVQDKSTNHIFKKAWVYQVSLTATDKRWNENTITSPVFIWEKDYPIWSYTVLNSTQNILKSDQNCDGNEAFLIKRWEKFTINTIDSVNSKWEKTNLKFYFSPQDDEIYDIPNLQYIFKQIWCKKIDAIVKEISTNKIDKKTVWFKVVNDLPTLDSMNIFFPQFGNEVGVWLWQWTKEKTFDPLKVNPLIVKVTANNSKDKDGSISQYIWYYYKKDDPTRQLELKSSPSSVPYMHFSIPTNDPALWAWDIVFWVKMIDNDGWSQLSEDIIWFWPTFFIPPCKTGWLCDNNMDVPIVTLTANKTETGIWSWEEVTFTTKTKVLSNRPDFDAKKVLRYDFDGDGVWDMTTKDSIVKYIYTKKYESIKPRVEVTYRKNSVVFIGDAITVKQSLKPRVEIHVYDKTVYIRDYSLWDIAKREICFNLTTNCQNILTWSQWLYTYTYDNYGTYSIVFKVEDIYGNNPKLPISVKLSPIENIRPLYFMSIPRSKVNEEWKYHIDVANDQNNSVLFNAIYSGSGLCYIDTDIADDANYDGKPDNDQDVWCNTMRLVKYDNYSDIINARVVYEWPDKKLIWNNIIIKFTDQEIALTQLQKIQYNKIQNLITSLPSTNEDQKHIKTLLVNMADDIRVNKSQTENIINLRVFLENTKAGFTDSQILGITKLLEEFETSDTVALNGGNIVDQARQFLVDFAPSDLMKSQVIASFDVIKNLTEPAGQPEIVKSEMQKVIQLFELNSVSQLESQNKWNEEKVIVDDIETQVLPKICDVLWFYSIASDKCPDGSWVQLEQTPSLTSTVWINVILKRLGIGVGILWGVFLLIVVFFAVKARIQQNNDEEVAQQ
jgi:PKD repeat protein